MPSWRRKAKKIMNIPIYHLSGIHSLQKTTLEAIQPCFLWFRVKLVGFTHQTFQIKKKLPPNLVMPWNYSLICPAEKYRVPKWFKIQIFFTIASSN
jgi:hypothetical protein